MGILVTAGAIGVMCVSGVVITTVFTWFGNIEIDLTKKKKDKENNGQHRERITEFKNRNKQTEIN